MDGYYVWDGSAIRGEDGRYHLFASRWPRELSMTPHWVTNSEIVRAVADRPEGPYEFEEVVFAPREPDAWDGKMTHNPSIHRYKDRFLLFYIGTTYGAEMPTVASPISGDARSNPVAKEARANQRIGLAVSESVYGPWSRPDGAVLQHRPGRWDGLMTVNPAPCVREDGSVLLVYKSTAHNEDLLRLGVARAESLDSEFVRISHEPIFKFDEIGGHVEDPFIWWSRPTQRYELIMKDMTGAICGEKHGGIHASSLDGVSWTVSSPAKAYSRLVTWDDGSTTTQGSLERPQLLIQEGSPTHLFAATADGPGDGFNAASRTWTMVIPLKRSSWPTL